MVKKISVSCIKPKTESPTEATMASHPAKSSSLTKPRITISKLPTNTSIQAPSKPRVCKPEDLETQAAPDATDAELIAEILKSMPKKFLKYNTLLTHLKVKEEGIFVDSYSTNTFLLISPKTLYPEIHRDDENLSNVSLPPWLEINVFYRINNKEKKKEVFNVSKIIDIMEGSDKFSIKVNTGEVIYEFFA
jgi:hypothetical protein